MDPLLNGSTFDFFIDEIFIVNSHEGDKSVTNKNNQEYLFGAILIPNIDSSYFPQMHLRRFLFSPEFLSLDYYKSYKDKMPELPPPENYQFRGTIIEGNYYSIPSHVFQDSNISRLLTPNFHDILEQHQYISPYVVDIDNHEILDLDIGVIILNEDPSDEDSGELKIYCFNVGQGDSLLVIFPNKNVYLIDTNIYSDGKVDKYADVIQNILKQNKLPHKQIKSLIITHKHLDHVRGADKLVEKFNIRNFLINYDYEHKTNVVYRLLNKAKEKISNKINVNRPTSYNEGKVEVRILNPKEETNSECKDLNDTSIVLLLKYGNSHVLLSGDAGYPVINSVLNKSISGENLLKISHHGSRTGTDSQLLNIFPPKFAYISAGNHKGYGHPHDITLNILNHINVDFSLSREDGSMLYSITERKIERALLSPRKL